MLGLPARTSITLFIVTAIVTPPDYILIPHDNRRFAFMIDFFKWSQLDGECDLHTHTSIREHQNLLFGDIFETPPPP